MAAGYTLKELMEFMGHADLQMVNRYVKLLPQPGEEDQHRHHLRGDVLMLKVTESDGPVILR